MFSVSRFVRIGLNKSSAVRIMGTNANFLKLKVNNFGAKVKDPGSDREVDKTKRSVGFGSTTSDSERREPSQRTIKVSRAQAQAKQEEQISQEEQVKQVNVQQEQTQQINIQQTQTEQVKSQEASQSSPSVKVITSIPGNRPPSIEDTIPGRYANTLFAVASEENNLYNVYEDMKYVMNLYENLQSFRIFADNSGLNAAQIFSFSQELARVGEFCATTLKFCDLLGKNKRFMFINEIAKKYIRAYLLLTKEEKITIISAQELTSQEKEEVKKALQANPDNEGKTFIIDYTVNTSIVGGLQMYTENKFMDLSLSSRVDKIKDEVNKLI